MTKTKLVEMYIGHSDHTWSTDYIDIPADTPDDKLIAVCEKIALEQFKSDWAPVFVGIYNIPPKDDEEN